jgi:DNA-nicking Smr family endonuclease
MVNDEILYDGLGIHSQPFPALLKSYLHQWLQQMPEIIAYHTAHSYHGGNSEVYTRPP